MTVLSCELELETENSASGLGVEERGGCRIKMGMNVCPLKGFCLCATTLLNTRDQPWSLTSGLKTEVNGGEILLCIMFPITIKKRADGKIVLPCFCSSWTMQGPFGLVSYSEETQR